MKKSLSIALALLMVFSCISVLFTGITASAAAGENHTVSTSVEVQDGLYGGTILTEATQTVAFGDSATVTAEPYYGNGFLGWYEGTTKVSDNLSYTFVVEGDRTLKAKFEINNLVEDGDLESETDAGVNFFNAETNSANAGQNVVIENPTTTGKHGKYVLKVDTKTANNTNCDILTIPFKVKKNTQYVIQLSYYSKDLAGTGYIGLHAEKSFVNGWTESTFVPSYTYHWHPEGTQNAGNYRICGGVNGSFAIRRLQTHNSVNAGKDMWVNFWLTFETGEADTIFEDGQDTAEMFMLFGVNNSTVNTFYVDNVSVTEAKTAANNGITATAAAGGTVTAQDAVLDSVYYIDNNGNKGENATQTAPVAGTTRYSNVLNNTYTAKADTGSAFLGWYDADNNLVSTAATYTFSKNGAYTAKFGSSVRASDGGYLTDNGDNTYTAKAFYGNKFLGWFENESATTPVSTDATVDTTSSTATYAKFTSDNQIFDGDFETGNPDTNAYWQDTPHYGNAAAPTYAVIDNPIKSSTAAFGDKVLSILPNQTGSNDKLKNLLNYPVEVEAGKTYMWRFAYTFQAMYDANAHYLNFSIDNWDASGKPTWGGGITSGYSIHSQTYSYAKDNDNDIFDNIWDYEWAWGYCTSKNYTGNKLASGANEWVDNYVIFTVPEGVSKVFLSLGTIQSITCPVLFDNMSFTEVNDGSKMPTVTAGENGKVVSTLDATMPAFQATKARGTKPVFENSILSTKPLFSSMYYDFHAVSDPGYLFDGWYKGGSKVSSDKQLRVAYNDDSEYVAKFVYDPNRYYVNAKVEATNGAYGGFLTGETEFNEVLSGSKITLNAVAYDGNSFLGWYDGNTLVSESASLEYAVSKNVTLTAKFKIGNLMPDSGYENTDVSTPVLGNGLEWSATDAEVYGNVVNLQAQSGANGINIGGAAGKEVKHAAVTVKTNTVYHIAFDWMLSRTGTDYGLEYVKVYNAADNALLGDYATFTAATGDWQKFYANVNTGSATSIYFVLKYKGASSSIYIDDVVFFDTTSAPFDITAEMEMDDIYPGYMTTDAVQHVNYGQNATVSVKTYTANKFLGWYKDGVKVSDNETYTFQALDFAKLTAKFEINNLITDSGFENSPKGQSLSDLDLWWVNETNKNLWGFDVRYDAGPFSGANAFTNGRFDIAALDGEKVLRAEHRNNSFGTTLTGLKENTNYVFVYYWQIQNIGPTAYLGITKLVGAQTQEELGGGRGVGIGNTSKVGYQKVMVPFFSGQNTEVNLTISYTAGSGSMYMDEMALYESDYITLIEGEGGSINTTFNDGNGSGPAQKGETIVLNAVADAGYEFAGWYDYTNPTNKLGTNTTYTFQANGAFAIAAYFKPVGATDYDPFNYFVDGDFENNCISPPIFDTTATWVSYGITPSANGILPYSGENFLRLSSPSQSTSFLIEHLEPNTTYTVSMAYNVPTGVNLESLSVYARRREFERLEDKNPAGILKPNPRRTASNGDRVSHECLGYIAVNERGTEGEWKTLEFTITTTNRTEAYFKVNYGRPSNKFSNDIYFDNIQIKKTSSGYTDTFVDGDFQTNSGIDGWQGALTTGTEGENKFAVLENGAGIFNNIELKRFTDYTVTFKARSAAAGTLSYGLTRGGRDLFKADGTVDAVTNEAWDEVALTSDWKEYSFDVTVPDMLHYTLHFIGGGAAVEVDDVKIEKTTSLKDYDHISFEPIEGKYITSAIIQNPSATFIKGSGLWCNDFPTNPKVYEIYAATNEGDAKVHSGVGSLIMKGFTSDEAWDTFSPGKDKSDASKMTDEHKNFNNFGSPLTQNFAQYFLQLGKTYELSYWVKAEKADTKYQSMIVETDGKWFLDDICSDEITVGTDWKKVTHKFVVGYNFDKTSEFEVDSVNTGGGLIRFVVNRVNPNNDSDIYFDDINIVQTASSVLNTNEENMYTQDISQNYLENYSFEKNTGALGQFSKAAKDAVYGDKIGTFTAGDKVIVPFTTRTNYRQTFSEVYTLAASVRGNASAQGGIYVAIDPEGKTPLASFETDEAVVISPNTDGKWKRSAFTFADERHTTLYLVIECTAGTFDVDYLEAFNADYGYKTVQYDETVITFDKDDESNYVDAGAGVGNYIAGEITGLPSGSKIVLKGDKTYSAEIADDGSYEINGIANGTYDMYIAASDAANMTLWGDITFKDTVLSGLACERLNGAVTSITGQGVRNGIVKIVDDDTTWAYLTATDANGEYTAYILDCSWFVEGTTKEAAALESYDVTLEQFNSGAATVSVAALETTEGGNIATPIICVAVMILATAALVLTRKKGVSM
ncbi:MAG: InlB B-repeat-containing protein [Clostridia bacterium]|nr:InlB B-repeat-containing protein [Clostridia bacterium]